MRMALVPRTAHRRQSRGPCSIDRAIIRSACLRSATQRRIAMSDLASSQTRTWTANVRSPMSWIRRAADVLVRTRSRADGACGETGSCTARLCKPGRWLELPHAARLADQGQDRLIAVAASTEARRLHDVVCFRCHKQRIECLTATGRFAASDNRRFRPPTTQDRRESRAATAPVPRESGASAWNALTTSTVDCKYAGESMRLASPGCDVA